METQRYTRKPFQIQAVQITHSNIAEVAEWCGGTVGEVPALILGTQVKLPCIILPKKDREDVKTAVGGYITERQGQFQGQSEKQFRASFDLVKDED